MTSKSHAGTSSSSKTGFLGGTPSSSSGQRAPGDPWTKRKAICFKRSTTPWCRQKRGKIKSLVWKRGLRGAPSHPWPIAVTKSSRSGEDPLVSNRVNCSVSPPEHLWLWNKASGQFPPCAAGRRPPLSLSFKSHIGSEDESRTEIGAQELLCGLSRHLL